MDYKTMMAGAGLSVVMAFGASTAMAATFQFSGSGTVNTSGTAAELVSPGTSIDIEVTFDVGPGQSTAAPVENVMGTVEIGDLGSFILSSGGSRAAGSSGNGGVYTAGFDIPGFDGEGVPRLASVELGFDLPGSPFETDTADLLVDGQYDFSGLRIVSLGGGNNVPVNVRYGISMSEFSFAVLDAPSEVPLPAGMTLLLTGLGVFGAGAVAKRRKAVAA